MTKHTLPEIGLDAFNCPHCGTYSRQVWRYFLIRDPDMGTLTSVNPNLIDKNTDKYLSISFCDKCNEYLIWHKDSIIYPYKSLAPMPAEDMPKEIIDDYIEASNILGKSPRSSAALLRLVIQKLLIILGEKGSNINNDIASLVSKGLLPERIKKALDIVRVVGNNAVHPGKIDLNDNPQIALAIFNLINIIIENTITRPKEIEMLYSTLPQGALDQIKIRDSK